MLQEGEILAGRYRVIELIAQGGMSMLYQGRDLRTNASVAIKVLKPEIADHPEIAERLRHEATILARLQHSNIVRYVDFLTFDGLPCLVMAWVEGETLRQRLAQRNGPYPVAEVDVLLHALCAALTHMQGHGIVHRDIKPGNILITPDGQPVLIDFGIALLRSTAEQDPLARMPAGAASYMAPEQMSGQRVDIRADIYALGTVIFEMLTGGRPFTDVERGASTDLRWERLREAKNTRAAPSLARYRTDLSPECVAAVDGALARLPEARWSTPDRLWAAWSPQTSPQPDSPNAIKPTNRRSMALMVATTVLLVGIALVFLLNFGRGATDKVSPDAAQPLDCQTAVPQGGLQWTMCIESATFDMNRLRVNVRWQVVIPAGQKWRKESDLNNPNMYLLDDQGQRYAINAVGGAAGEAVLMGAQTLQGWFEFATAVTPHGQLTFVDNDMGLKLRFTAR
jgi:serine/threonine protein kinase